MKAIRTKYHGPGNVRGARISATDDDGNRVIISYNHASGEPHDIAAIALCSKMGWHGTLARGSLKHGNVYVWCDDARDQILIPTPRGRADRTVTP